MSSEPQNISNKKNSVSRPIALNADDKLLHLAFDNSAQPNIITIISNGKIIMVNNAASKLFGYSKKQLLSKNRSDIFNIKESSFKNMLQQRTEQGNSVATVTVLKKMAKPLHAK